MNRQHPRAATTVCSSIIKQLEPISIRGSYLPIWQWPLTYCAQYRGLYLSTSKSAAVQLGTLFSRLSTVTVSLGVGVQAGVSVCAQCFFGSKIRGRQFDNFLPTREYFCNAVASLMIGEEVNMAVVNKIKSVRPAQSISDFITDAQTKPENLLTLFWVMIVGTTVQCSAQSAG